MHHISEHGLKFIEREEGFRATIYDDGTGVMTIGYGTTAADISPLPHHCTEHEAEGWLRDKLHSKYEPVIHALAHDIGHTWTQNQFDALCSFVYNLGPGILGAQHTIGHLLREKQWQKAADSMLLYDDPGTNVTAGLLARRKAERAMFLKG